MSKDTEAIGDSQDPSSDDLGRDGQFPRERVGQSKIVQTAMTSLVIVGAKEDRRHLMRLMRHLAPLQRESSIEIWSTIMIIPGFVRSVEISRRFSLADIVVLLLSANLMASDDYERIAAAAVSRSEAGLCAIIPVKLRPVDLARSPWEKFQGFPDDGRAIIDLARPESAWVALVTGIRSAILELEQRRSAPLIAQTRAAG